MKTVTTLAALRSARAKMKGSVGFVPTMGALHEGHASLIRRAAKTCDHVVVSVFVNPTQFGKGEDFKKYPRTFKADLKLAKDAGADLVFAPDAKLLYPPGDDTRVEAEKLSQPLCGEFRPGHFKGVATVVTKLFNLVQPTHAFFGQKDAQQVRVIEQVTRDLFLSPKIVVCPTVREADGLAISSRNRYLSADERERALTISRSLFEVERMVKKGQRDAGHLISIMEAALGAVCETVQYADIVDMDTLRDVAKLKKGGKYLCAVAVFVGTTRLIDNVVLRA